MKITIPDFLSHLPVQGGYPVPYFVAWLTKDGVKRADFRLFDGKKQLACLKYHLCFICGKPIAEPGGFLVGGEVGLKNCVSSDTFMHERCARFSIEVCPHLHFQKLDRRDGLPVGVVQPEYMMPDKPKIICLIQAEKYQIINPPGMGLMINFRPDKAQRFHYKEGLLVSFDEQLLPCHPTTWRKYIPVNPLTL